MTAVFHKAIDGILMRIINTFCFLVDTLKNKGTYDDPVTLVTKCSIGLGEENLESARETNHFAEQKQNGWVTKKNIERHDTAPL